MFKKAVMLLGSIAFLISSVLLVIAEDPNQAELTNGLPRGVSIFENTDAKNYTDDNAQSVKLTAPFPAACLDGSVSMLNNVSTNTSRFLQNGLSVDNTWGKAIYTVNTDGYPATYPAINYVVQDKYRFFITYTNTKWWMCAENLDVTPTNYTCTQQNLPVTGTHLKGDQATSVFVETNCPGTGWKQDADPVWYAKSAKIYRNGIAQNWTTIHKHTSHRCMLLPTPTSYPPAPALNGSLINNGQGRFIIASLPPACP